jgi:hypothetical protein
MTVPADYPPQVTAASWNAVAAHVRSGLTGGITQYPYSFLVRENGVFYEAVDSVGVLTFGGSGNAGGVDGTNAASVVQAAIDEAADDAFGTNSGHVHINKGTYIITATITCPSAKRVLLTGDGWFTSWFIGSVALGAAPIFSIIDLVDATAGGITFRDLSFQGVANNIGIYVEQSPKWTNIEGCYFETFTGTGAAIKLKETFCHHISGCGIVGNYVGVWLIGSAVQAIAIMHITDNTITGNTYGLYGESYFNDLYVENNDMESNGRTVYLDGALTGFLDQSRGEFCHNYMEGASMAAGDYIVYLSSTNAKTCNLTFQNNHIDAADIGNCVAINNVKGTVWRENTFLFIPAGKVVFAFNNSYLPIWIDRSNSLHSYLGTGMFYNPNYGSMTGATGVNMAHNLPANVTVATIGVANGSGLKTSWDANATTIWIYHDSGGANLCTWWATCNPANP